MDFNSYSSFLKSQADLIHSNNQLKAAIGATKHLIARERNNLVYLESFPSIDKELARSIISCTKQHDDILQIGCFSNQSSLGELTTLLEYLNKVEADISEVLDIPLFIDGIYANTTTENLEEKIALSEKKLYMVNEKKQILQLGNTVLKQNLIQIDNIIKLNPTWIEITNSLKEKSKNIKEKSKNLLSLTVSDIKSLIKDTELLISDINLHQSNLDKLASELKNFNDVEPNISKVLEIPTFVDDIRRNTTTQNLEKQFTIVNMKLNILHDKRQVLQLSSALDEKLVQLDDLIKAKRFLITIKNDYKQRSKELIEESKDLLSLTSDEVKNLISNIEKLNSDIYTFLESEKKQLIVIVICLFISIIIFLNITAVIGFILAILKIVGFVIIIAIILWILSFSKG